MAVRFASDAWEAGRIDTAKVEATTEAQIRVQMIEDGDNPDAPFIGYRLKGTAEPESATKAKPKRDQTMEEREVLHPALKRVHHRNKVRREAPVSTTQPRKTA